MGDPGIAYAHLRPSIVIVPQFPQNWQQSVKRGVHTLRHVEFQLLVVRPGMLTPEEREAAKEIDAIDLL